MTSASGGRNRVAHHCKVDWCRAVRLAPCVQSALETVSQIPMRTCTLHQRRMCVAVQRGNLVGFLLDLIVRYDVEISPSYRRLVSTANNAFLIC